MSFHVTLLVSSKFSALREHSLSCHRKTSIIFSPCISLYIHCFLSTTQKLQDHLLFCRLINSLMHALFSFYLGCCLTDSPDSKQRHCAAPWLFRAGCDYVTIHQGKSAWDSCFARRTDSLFSFTIVTVRNETVPWFSPSAPLRFHKGVFTPTSPCSSQMYSSPS